MAKKRQPLLNSQTGTASFGSAPPAGLAKERTKTARNPVERARPVAKLRRFIQFGTRLALSDAKLSNVAPARRDAKDTAAFGLWSVSDRYGKPIKIGTTRTAHGAAAPLSCHAAVTSF